MNLKDAQRHAHFLVDHMRPFCDRIAIAGSVRREKQDCHDIEIVAIPTFTTTEEKRGLFGDTETVSTNILHDWATGGNCPVVWIKTGTPKVEYIEPAPDGRHWKGLLGDGQTRLDLFLCAPDNWGAIYLIRTGSAEFSREVATFAKYQTDFRFSDGSLARYDANEQLQNVKVPEERDVFSLLGLQYIEPKERHSKAQVIRL